MAQGEGPFLHSHRGPIHLRVLERPSSEAFPEPPGSTSPAVGPPAPVPEAPTPQLRPRGAEHQPTRTLVDARLTPPARFSPPAVGSGRSGNLTTVLAPLRGEAWESNHRGGRRGEAGGACKEPPESPPHPLQPVPWGSTISCPQLPRETSLSHFSL